MNTTQPLNKILFLLDEISACKQRISIATDVTRDIEVAVLQAKTVELYSEIQQYNRQTLQPAAAQIPVNHYQAAPLKEAYKAPKQETVTPPKTETTAQRQEPVIEKPQPVTEPAKPQPQPITEEKPVAPQPVQPQQPQPRKEVSDFERKREKLLREEEEFRASQHNVNTQTAASQPVQEAKLPKPIHERPIETKPEPVQQKPVAEPKPQPVQQPVAYQEPEIQKPEPQAAPEPSKPNVSQLYAQARERTATSTGAEKSLNEKLATSQTSLNDKFQSHVKKNLADKLKLSPISDLRTAININQRVAFINKLFKGDDKEFKNVVTTVNGFRNFSEAKFFVQSEVAPRFSWNENDDTVQEFMELVYRKFL